MSGFRRVRGQRQQVRTFAPAQMLHGQVHLAARNLQRRILGHRRLHFLRQETFACLEDLQHDMKPVYRLRSQRSNFLQRRSENSVGVDGTFQKLAVALSPWQCGESWLVWCS